MILTGSLLAPSSAFPQAGTTAVPAARPAASAFLLMLPSLDERRHYLADRLDGWHTMIGEKSAVARDFLPEMAELQEKLGAVKTPAELTTWALVVDAFESRLMDRLDPRIPMMRPEAAAAARQALMEKKETLAALNRRRIGADPRTAREIDGLKKQIKEGGLSAQSLSHIFERAQALTGSAVPLMNPIQAALAPAFMADRSYPRPAVSQRPYGGMAVPEPAGPAFSASPDNLDEARVAELARANGMNASIVLQAFRESRRQGVDFRMTLAVIESESAFNPHATSAVGARGLMQIMPGTGQGLGVRDSNALYDVATNIRAGVRYLKGLWEQFSDVAWAELGSLNPSGRPDVKAAIAAYNAGPGAVQKYGGVPPYRETRNYVVTVLSNFNKYQRLFSA